MTISRRSVFITGAGGRIGSAYARYARDRYDLHLMVQDESQREKVEGLGAIHVADLSDYDRLVQAMRGCRTVVHLAATADYRAGWDRLLPLNVVGCYNALQAAADAGCQRVIFASSIHAVMAYPREQQVRETDAGRPANLYGVSKCFGEAMCSYLAHGRNLSAIAIRIGGYRLPEQAAERRVAANRGFFVSPDDLNRLLDLAIDAPDHVRYAVVHATSRNASNRLDWRLTHQLLGYEPRDVFPLLPLEMDPALT